MFLGLNNENRYQIVVDVVDDTIMSSYMPRVGYIFSPDEWFRMTKPCTRVFHDIEQHICGFFKQAWIRFFPFSQCFIGLFGIFYSVVHRLLK